MKQSALEEHQDMGEEKINAAMEIEKRDLRIARPERYGCSVRRPPSKSVSKAGRCPFDVRRMLSGSNRYLDNK